MSRLRAIAKEARSGIEELLVTPLTEEQTEKVERIVEQAMIEALLEWRQQAVEAALQVPEADRDLTHKIAINIRQNCDALIANLSSMR
jgi:hypothetical protein